MTSALITLLILVIVCGVVFYLLSLLIDMIPMDARFLQIAKILLILIFILIILAKALPLLGVSLN